MTAAGKPPRGLGRGLDALLPTKPKAAPTATAGASNVFDCPIEKIAPQEGQPRQHFDKRALDELAQSIREHGLIEPLIVRKRGSGYELVAGERRWRAAQRAGLHEVQVVVRELSAKEAFELALIENVQREDLNPIELAEALRRLVDEHDYSQDSLAERLGKDRSTVANALRLLKLPDRVRQMVIEGHLSEGHARALLGADSVGTMTRLADKAVKSRLSVRQLEALVRAFKKSDGTPKKGKPKNAATRDLEMRLARKLGTKCTVKDRKGKGEIVLQYSSLDELDRLLDLIL